MKEFFSLWAHVFVPLFVAVDVVGTLPLFVALTHGLKPKDLKKTIRNSMITAIAVAVMFLWIGQYVLNLLGISVPDFTIAGGLLLLLISLGDYFSSDDAKKKAVDPKSIGAVPVGVPMIVGPAVLTASVILQTEFGFWPTAVSLVINILVAGLVFRFSPSILKLLGATGTRILSKLSNLLLTVIAVMLIRKGIVTVVQSFSK